MTPATIAAKAKTETAMPALAPPERAFLELPDPATTGEMGGVRLEGGPGNEAVEDEMVDDDERGSVDFVVGESND